MSHIHDEHATAELMKKRREMRRHYTTNYESESMHPLPPEPILFLQPGIEETIPRTSDSEQMAALSDDHKQEVQMSFEEGLFYGFIGALVVVAVVTVALLVMYAR